MSRQLTIFLLSVALSYTPTLAQTSIQSIDVDAAVAKAFVDRHNELRRLVATGNAVGANGAKLPAAANMAEVKWNDRIAKEQKVFADKCLSGHVGMNAADTYLQVGLGQNKWQGFSNSVTPLTQTDLLEIAKSSTDSWNSEIQYMNADFTCQSGKVCGHFTQLARDDVREIGCAISFCQNPSGSTWKTTKQIYCNYYPATNSETPYKIGPACSMCGHEATQTTNLCYSTCNNNLCAGWGTCGTKPCNPVVSAPICLADQAVCANVKVEYQDTEPDCADYVEYSGCNGDDSNYDWIKASCQGTCSTKCNA
jgi:hypothetical protein